MIRQAALHPAAERNNQLLIEARLADWGFVANPLGQYFTTNRCFQQAVRSAAEQLAGVANLLEPKTARDQSRIRKLPLPALRLHRQVHGR